MARTGSRSASALGSNFATTNGLHVYGNQKMGVYANATGANTQFFLTRVLPGEAGKTLVLNFFDTGDASQPGTLAVLPPPDSNVTGGVFANCLFTAAPGQRHRPAVGHLQQPPRSGCKITGVSNSGTPNYNGQWVTWEIPIPGTYTCNDADPLGCWTQAPVHLSRRAPTSATRPPGPPTSSGSRCASSSSSHGGAAIGVGAVV